MGDWNNVSKNLSEVLVNVAKDARKITIGITDVLNNFAKSEEFQRVVEIFSNIPDDVQKTVFFQKCQKLSKKDLTYEEMEWLINELEIFSMEEARAVVQKYSDKDNAVHNYIKDIMNSIYIPHLKWGPRQSRSDT